MKLSTALEHCKTRKCTWKEMLLRHLVSFTKLPWIPLLTSISSLQPIQSSSYICSTVLKNIHPGRREVTQVQMNPFQRKTQGYTLGKPRTKVLSTTAMRQQPKPGSSSAHSSGTRTKSPIASSNLGDGGAGTGVISSFWPWSQASNNPINV